VRFSRELLEELLRLSVTNDVAQVDLYADDAVHELPFSPSGSPIRMTRDQMRAAMTAPGPERVTDRNLRITRSRNCMDPDVLRRINTPIG
jgi:hypothetical protein